MATTISQLQYGFAGDPKGPMIQQDDKEIEVVSKDDYMEGMAKVETAISQILIQNNSDTIRLGGVINESGLAALDPGTATLADVVNLVNSLVSIQQQTAILPEQG